MGDIIFGQRVVIPVFKADKRAKLVFGHANDMYAFKDLRDGITTLIIQVAIVRRSGRPLPAVGASDVALIRVANSPSGADRKIGINGKFEVPGLETDPEGSGRQHG